MARDFFIRQANFSPESWVDSKKNWGRLVEKDPPGGVLTIFRYTLEQALCGGDALPLYPHRVLHGKAQGLKESLGDMVGVFPVKRPHM